MEGKERCARGSELRGIVVHQLVRKCDSIIPIKHSILAEIWANSPFSISTSDTILRFDPFSDCCRRGKDTNLLNIP